MNKLQELLDKTPAWLRRFNRKYQLKTVLRMNELLRCQGLSQKDLAKKAGWTEGYVSRILSGQQNLTLKTLARFEEAIGADVLEVTEAVQPERQVRLTTVSRLHTEEVQTLVTKEFNQQQVSHVRTTLVHAVNDYSYVFQS